MPRTTPNRRPRCADQSGQASLDYLAVVGLLAVILGVIGTVTVGPGLVNAVGEGIQRAICRVTGDSCQALVRQVCTVQTSGTELSASVKLTFVRVGRSAAILRSERSDGTVDLTLLDKGSAGLIAGVGASGHVEIGGHPIGASALAQASLVADLGGGRVWRVPDKAAADRLQRKLVEVLAGRAGSALPVVGGLLAGAQAVLDIGSGTDLPKPTSRILSGKVSAKATFEGPFGSELKAGAEAGGSLDTVSGVRTFFFGVEGEAGVALLADAAGLGAGVNVKAELVIDRHGRPVSLSISGSGHVGGLMKRTGATGGARADQANEIGLEANGEATATLDLTVPENAVAAKRLLRALTPGRAHDLAGAVLRLGRAFRDGARVDVAVYRAKDRKYGGGLEGALGARVGADLEVSRSSSQILDAWTRPPGGAWERRTECLVRA